jgi:hypothetical protein
MKQASLFQEEEVMDLVAQLINQLGHTGIIEDVLRWEQTKREYLRLVEHPLYKAAEQRRRDKFWNSAERVAKRVESWPDWKKGK